MQTFKALSLMLAYPTEELQQAINEIADVLKREAILPARHRRALNGFMRDLQALDTLDAQERYVGLFDRNRALSLHLYEHIHGESRERGQAMVQLSQLYKLHGLEIAERELPDYLPLFLEFLSLLPERAARSLLGQCSHVVAALREKLGERRSGYAEVLAAIEALAAKPAERAAVDEVIAALRPEADDLGVLDRQWEEEAVRFTGGTSPDAAGGARCGG